jgi:hypothetical protein
MRLRLLVIVMACSNCESSTAQESSLGMKEEPCSIQ